MKKELESQLVKDFPLCFGDYGKDMKQTCMYWGCACGDGWEPIIREACTKAEIIIANWIKNQTTDKSADQDWTPRLAQVKEKFGTLRLYFTSYPDGMDEIEMIAERKSAEICETCGKPGKLRGNGWLYTSCAEHSKEGDLESLEIVEEASIRKENVNG